VVAPLLIPRRPEPSDKAEPPRRNPARQTTARAGELPANWPQHTMPSTMLVRSRDAAVDDLRRKRLSISSLKLRYGRSYPRKKTWGARRPQRMLAQRFEHPAQQLVL